MDGGDVTGLEGGMPATDGIESGEGTMRTAVGMTSRTAEGVVMNGRG